MQEADSLGQAVRTIILADVVMSLDNILAVGGAAKGHLGLMMFGLLLSIPIILFGSELVARLIGRFPGFLYVGVFVLIHAAVAMIAHDPIVAREIHTTTWQELAISLLITSVFALLARRMERGKADEATPPASTAAVAAPKRLVTATVASESGAAVPVRQRDESGSGNRT